MKQKEILAKFKKFKDEESVETKKEMVEDLCTQLKESELKESEKDIVSEIISILSNDLEEEIRSSISFTLKDSDLLPHDVALKLAKDIEKIAIPILEFSKILTDDDLCEIISETTNVNKLRSIAKREEISETVSESLVRTGNEDVVYTLVENEGARISELSIDEILDAFEESQQILGSLIKRNDLGIRSAERMLHMVSEQLQNELVTKFHFDESLVRKKVTERRENIVISVISKSANARTKDLVNHLDKTGRLTQSIIMRALCSSDLDFFINALSKRANISIENANKLLFTDTLKGYLSLFKAAKMPEILEEASGIIFKYITQYINENHSRDPDNKYCIQSVSMRITEENLDIDIPHMGYLLALINHNDHIKKRKRSG